ncbi:MULTISPECIES: 50S ribosomal protein L28 [Thermoflexus]|jgi:large subunit ribosomal protein L28|uniref:50S ribosomal protein L28 n=1 Tax=Thermoflexus TaxID=1495649 RepID=UPI001B0BA368|nr:MULTISPECIES: 50S ribosomal protein L28 [Thermoflexus]MBO9363283.1 50S ribosomal protein L28 [Thermoflexus sp.]QWK09676.1 MAG: 50S ribosomal protein L28 [Thermoflexus hugenholtzii]
MARCELCGKGTAFGNYVSHSNHAERRRFMANVQKKRVTLNGVTRRIHICTRCLKALHKARA